MTPLAEEKRVELGGPSPHGPRHHRGCDPLRLSLGHLDLSPDDFTRILRQARDLPSLRGRAAMAFSRALADVTHGSRTAAHAWVDLGIDLGIDIGATGGGSDSSGGGGISRGVLTDSNGTVPGPNENGGRKQGGVSTKRSVLLDISGNARIDDACTAALEAFLQCEGAIPRAVVAVDATGTGLSDEAVRAVRKAGGGRVAVITGRGEDEGDPRALARSGIGMESPSPVLVRKNGNPVGPAAAHHQYLSPPHHRGYPSSNAEVQKNGDGDFAHVDNVVAVPGSTGGRGRRRARWDLAPRDPKTSASVPPSPVAAMSSAAAAMYTTGAASLGHHPESPWRGLVFGPHAQQPGAVTTAKTVGAGGEMLTYAERLARRWGMHVPPPIGEAVEKDSTTVDTAAAAAAEGGFASASTSTSTTPERPSRGGLPSNASTIAAAAALGQPRAPVTAVGRGRAASETERSIAASASASSSSVSVSSQASQRRAAATGKQSERPVAVPSRRGDIARRAADAVLLFSSSDEEEEEEEEEEKQQHQGRRERKQGNAFYSARSGTSQSSRVSSSSLQVSPVRSRAIRKVPQSVSSVVRLGRSRHRRHDAAEKNVTTGRRVLLSSDSSSSDSMSRGGSTRRRGAEVSRDGGVMSLRDRVGEQVRRWFLESSSSSSNGGGGGGGGGSDDDGHRRQRRDHRRQAKSTAVTKRGDRRNDRRSRAKRQDDDCQDDRRTTRRSDAALVREMDHQRGPRPPAKLPTPTGNRSASVSLMASLLTSEDENDSESEQDTPDRLPRPQPDDAEPLRVEPDTARDLSVIFEEIDRIDPDRDPQPRQRGESGDETTTPVTPNASAVIGIAAHAGQHHATSPSPSVSRRPPRTPVSQRLAAGTAAAASTTASATKGANSSCASPQLPSSRHAVMYTAPVTPSAFSRLRAALDRAGCETDAAETLGRIVDRQQALEDLEARLRQREAKIASDEHAMAERVHAMRASQRDKARKMEARLEEREAKVRAAEARVREREAELAEAEAVVAARWDAADECLVEAGERMRHAEEKERKAELAMRKVLDRVRGLRKGE